jgi:type II secretory pathway component GspD/PulD (secretin)
MNIVVLPLVLAAFFGLWDSEESKAVNAVSNAVIAVDEAQKLAKEAAALAAKEAADLAAKNFAEAKAAWEAEKANADAAKAEAKEARELAKAEAKEAAAEAKAVKEEQRAERKEQMMRIDTRIFRLNHASAQEVAEKFNEMWNGEFGQVWKVSKMAVAFQESNSVMITAPTLILDACQKMIKELDVEAQQVYIEARFVELSNNASHKLGIDWQMLDGMTGSTKLGGGIQRTTLGKGVSNYTRNEASSGGTTSYNLSGAGGSDGDITYFNGTLDFSEMYLIMRALEASEDARVFSNPKIIVSSGKKAKVDMTEKYPNVTISAKRTSNGGGSDSLDLSMNMAAIPGEDKFMFAKEAFFSWGIELEVTPRINTNGLINVAIVPTISSQTDWVTAGAGDTSEKSNAGTYSSKYPVLNVQRLITEFNMASETTAVIGGLSRTTEKQVDNGIPWLRTWPWIGPKLFGSKVRIKEQKEILVFVTVGLVNPREMKKDAGLPKNAVIGRRYTNGQRLEPGDRAMDSIEGMGGLDLRPLEEQAKDPLPQIKAEDEKFIDFKNIPMPFTKDEKYLKNREKK